MPDLIASTNLKTIAVKLVKRILFKSLSAIINFIYYVIGKIMVNKPLCRFIVLRAKYIKPYKG